MQKKKSKSAKGKERPGLERENSSDSLASDSKPKKRTSEVKESTKDSKKQRREDIKDTSKKKGEVKDLKKKLKEESKESKHLQKGKYSSLRLDDESSMPDDSFSQGADIEDLDSDNSEDKHKTCHRKEPLEERMSWISVQQPDSSSNTDDSSEIKVKSKTKKHKKGENLEDSRKVDRYFEKKSTHKKQKTQEKAKAAVELDSKRPTIPAPVQKCPKLSLDERGRKSIDSAGEVSSNTKLKSKEAKLSQSSARDVPQKSTVAESKEKKLNLRDEEERMKERPSEHCVGESLFEKFTLHPESTKGGSTVSKKNLSKSTLNIEEASKERGTSSKVI